MSGEHGNSVGQHVFRPRYISGANPAQGDTRDNRPNPHSIGGRGFVPVGASLRLEAHGLP